MLGTRVVHGKRIPGRGVVNPEFPGRIRMENPLAVNDSQSGGRELEGSSQIPEAVRRASSRAVSFQKKSGSSGVSCSYWNCSWTLKRPGLVAQASSPAGSPGVPPGVPPGGETPPQLAAGMAALHASWVASNPKNWARIGTLNRGIGAPVSDPAGNLLKPETCRVGDRRSGSWVASPHPDTLSSNHAVVVPSTAAAAALLPVWRMSCAS